MRLFLVLLTGLVLSQTTVASDYDADLDQSDYSASAEPTFGTASGGWNRWTCNARGTRLRRLFHGTSYYFRDQSGEGQEAKRVAQKIAVRNCEFVSNERCMSSLSSCRVESN